MSNMPKPPPRIFNEEPDRAPTKRPVSKLTQLTEPVETNDKRGRSKKDRTPDNEIINVPDSTTAFPVLTPNSNSEPVTTDTGQSRTIAANPELDPKHLAELAKSDSEQVRVAVASNPNTDVKTLTRLKKDKNPDVLIALLGNPNLPAKLLAGFVPAAKKDNDVLAALSKRDDLPPRLEKQLAKLLP